MSRPGRKRKQDLAFAKNSQLPDRIPPGPARLWKITAQELESICALIRVAWTPVAAAVKILAIHDSSHTRWMKEGADPEGDEMAQAYFNAIHQAEMDCRGNVEQRIHAAGLEDWRAGAFQLQHGHLGRSRPDVPGYDQGQSVTMKHTDHTGEAPARVIMEFTRLGRLEMRREELSEGEP
jgi:hypothetical protein